MFAPLNNQIATKSDEQASGQDSEQTITQLIAQVIRTDVRALNAYVVQDATGMVKLDAMENPYPLPSELQEQLGRHLAEVALNRYPQPTYALLKSKLRAHFAIPDGCEVMLGNGSDELISLMATACAKPGAVLLAPTPGFVMVELAAQLAGMRFVGVPLSPDFALDQPAMLAAMAEHRPALTFLAYPNNPTGNLFDAAHMSELIAAAAGSGLVVVDEAYQPFADSSFMERLPHFAHLLVLRTVSKLGLAGLRLGYLAGAPALLREFDKVRPPYNINVLTQAAAEFLLGHGEVLDGQAALIRAERTELVAALSAVPGVVVFPSSANFLLIRVANADKVYFAMKQLGVLVKNVGKMATSLHNCLRITVGTAAENALMLDALRAALADNGVNGIDGIDSKTE
ncbi:histidinol-phosphate transaminase [Herbaspirillum sp. RTI4]|uniref:histidinol-phosphate transaminase n=1 Tax=Herbaspirillum sp. RTI4 TaxID=3048640 RepID=UPI002AB5C540|nr:histidinol-phosphate transaminase [Herbaspirillum sp. RTI4]MDY7577749.1 histidinol-phosphate transaminase [Herbaspirillum sp. RTI4]MEA9980823.1 histidinol-phosphate transaminase [Herbaspirillum sp. RTI4]